MEAFALLSEEEKRKFLSQAKLSIENKPGPLPEAEAKKVAQKLVSRNY